MSFTTESPRFAKAVRPRLFRPLCVALAALCAAPALAADGMKKVLTSVEKNLRVDAWEHSFESGNHQVSIKKHTLHGGRQEGVDVIVVDNGRMKLTIVPTRGMSVYEVVQGDVRLGWNSPVKELVHPREIDLSRRGGLGFLDGFNEWMVRCGLESAGHPGKDKFINNVGEEAELDLTVHGRIGNTPASEVVVTIDPAPKNRIRVRGRMDERSFYGPKLEMWSEISVEPGASSFQISDVVTNRGGAEQEFQILYHGNYGPPLLEEGAKFVGPIRQVTPFNDHAAKDVDKYTVYAGPTDGFIEQVYNLVPYGDEDGRTRVMLHNAAADKGVAMSYLLSQLPYLTLWKNTLGELDGYVTGVEPGTGFPYNRRIERKFGRVPKLKPGQSRKFVIDFEVLADKQAVAAVAADIKKIQNDRETQVDRKPAEIKED
jgi:hypothetical protein